MILADWSKRFLRNYCRRGSYTVENTTGLRGFTIVVAGKGGTGKTLVSALLVKDQVKHGALLAIDADPDCNLAEALGVSVPHTVGHVRESLLTYKTRRTENSTVTAEKIFEQGIMEAIAENRGFDLLVMGRGEGEGCYCAVNHILRSVINTQTRNYATVIIDSEAGLEHISRRTARDVDVMLVVTDTSARGVTTARRVRELADQLKVTFGRILLLANKMTAPTEEIIVHHAAEADLELVGVLPFDQQVAHNDALGKSIWELTADCPMLVAFKDVCSRLDVIRKDKARTMGIHGGARTETVTHEVT